MFQECRPGRGQGADQLIEFSIRDSGEHVRVSQIVVDEDANILQRRQLRRRDLSIIQGDSRGDCQMGDVRADSRRFTLRTTQKDRTRNQGRDYEAGRRARKLDPCPREEQDPQPGTGGRRILVAQFGRNPIPDPLHIHIRCIIPTVQQTIGNGLGFGRGSESRGSGE